MFAGSERGRQEYDLASCVRGGTPQHSIAIDERNRRTGRRAPSDHAIAGRLDAYEVEFGALRR
jgi:hypothetical protein